MKIYEKNWPQKIQTHIRINYQLDAIEYLFVYFQRDMFRAYTHMHSIHTRIPHTPQMGYTCSITTKIHIELDNI